MSGIQFIPSPPLPSLSDPSSGKQVVYSFNSKIMVAAMAILFVVVLFVVGLHVYAKWFWRHGTTGSRWSTTRALNSSWRRRRHRPEFVTDESMFTNACIGLDPSTVNSLPTFIYEGAGHEAEPLLECAVCLSEFQIHDKGRILPDCKHSFHIDCIDMWFHSHSTCPLCRTPVSSPMPYQQLAGNTSNHPLPFLQHTALSTMHQRHDDDENTFAAQRVCPPLSLLQNSSTSPMILADPHAPVPLLQSMAGLELHPRQEEGPAKNAGMAPMSRKLIPSMSMSCSYIPSHGELLCRDDITRVSLPHMGASGSSSTRSMPTEILRQQERATIGRSTSLSLSRHISEDVQACSPQPQKSSSFRMSIKWLLSRELSKGRSKVFPSGEDSAELEQNTGSMNLPV